MDENAPLTLFDRLRSLGDTCLYAGITFTVGLLLLYVIGRGAPARASHGRYVLFWAVAGCLASGLYRLGVIEHAEDLSDRGDPGYRWFGMLLGWAIGMMHGSVTLRLASDGSLPRMQKATGDDAPPDEATGHRAEFAIPSE